MTMDILYNEKRSAGNEIFIVNVEVGGKYMKQVGNIKGTVLITGASTGIGYELTKLFAKDNYNLVLVARNIEKLNSMANEIQEKYGVQVKAVGKDLSLPDSSYEIFKEITGCNIDIDVLVNNAGSGSCGLFHEIDYEKDIEMIQLNVTSLTCLTKLFARKMIEKGNGKILNVASTGAYQPGPYIAVYYATKAYVLSFSEAIYNELKDYGITVTTICPGATKTEFSKRAGKMDIKTAMDPKTVAISAFNGLKKNKRLIIPGTANKIAIIASKLLPGSILAKTVGKIQKSLVERKV